VEILIVQDADTVVKKEIFLTATENASGNSVDANTLFFDCGDPWSKAPVTITFVNFLFTKVDPDDIGYDDEDNSGGDGGAPFKPPAYNDNSDYEDIEYEA